MSVQITTAFVEQYKANVSYLAQQKGSRLRSTVDEETATGKTAYFEQIGSVAARKRTSRHADTPRMDTPHARRRVTLSDYDWADLIDQEDKVRLLTDPASAYARAAAWAMGRAIDDEILLAADGTAFTGVDGSTPTAFDAGMIVDVQVRDPGVSAADYGLNVAKLIEAKRLLDAKDVDPDEARFIIVNAGQLASLLKTTKATSADYNTVRALVQGQIDTFMGFRFVRTERIGKDVNGDDKVLFYAKSGIKLAVGEAPVARISERPDKNHATQVFYAMTIGATRMEETRVGYVECDPAAGPGA